MISSKPYITENHKIIYGHTFFDHIPISFDLVLPDSISKSNINTLKGGEDGGVCWDKASSDDKKLYIDNLENIYLYLWDDVLACNDPNCSNTDHIMSLNSLYQNIMHAIKLSSECLHVYS